MALERQAQAVNHEIGEFNSPTPITRLYIPRRNYWNAYVVGVANDLNFLLYSAFYFKGLGLLNMERYPQDIPKDLNDRLSVSKQDAQDADRLFHLATDFCIRELYEQPEKKAKRSQVSLELQALIKSIKVRYPQLKNREKLVEIPEERPEILQKYAPYVSGAMHDCMSFWRGLIYWADDFLGFSRKSSMEQAYRYFISLTPKDRITFEQFDTRVLDEGNFGKVPLNLVYNFFPMTLEEVLKTELAPDLSYDEFEEKHCDFQDYNLPPDLKTNYSLYWLATLTRNVAQNTVRSFQRRDRIQPWRKDDPKKVSSRYQYDPVGKTVSITITDTGTGFDERILKEGYIRGQTTDPGIGKGLGMAGQVEMLQRLGIKAENRNIVNEQDQPVGAIQTFVFPVV